MYQQGGNLYNNPLWCHQLGLYSFCFADACVSLYQAHTVVGVVLNVTANLDDCGIGQPWDVQHSIAVILRSASTAQC